MLGGRKVEEEFPILCETCLGENPCVRMTREPYGKACKICDRPFTVFRWRPGPRARYKKTELCPTCAKLKNVCQTCVLDLEYGLPVQVRDQALEEHERIAMPKSDTNLQFFAEQHEKQVGIHGANPYQNVNPDEKANAFLSKLRRKTPYYRRNLPHLCSFFAQGTCNRGSACPFRHEMPVTGELANQNIKDRYYGVNDPVAKKLMGRSLDGPTAPPPPPADRNITTIWVGGVDEKMSETDVRNVFYPYGEISSVSLVPNRFCGFVTYIRRDSAEEAMAALFSSCEINGSRVRIDWGKGGRRNVAAPPGVQRNAPLVFNPDSTTHLSAPAPMQAPPGVAPPPGMKAAKPYYPSMDPKHMASKVGE